MAQCAPFETHSVLAVAVSGGADSMALALLAHRWVQKQGGAVVALTVDHGLRAESAQEALLVKEWCEAQGMEHHILTWHPPVLSSALQAQAREARYQLLSQWCRVHHVLHLLTAHHRGDQAETLFFRLARGSGIEGLACMASVSAISGIRLLRPLLGIAKSRLEAMLMENRQPWVEDPSNRNTRHTRNHIRAQLHQSGHADSLSERGIGVVESLGQFRKFLEHKLASYLTEAISIFPEGYGIIDVKAFVQLPVVAALDALSALAMSLNGDAYPPRSEKLERFYQALSSPPQRRRTFSGLLFIPQPAKQQILVCREPNALPPDMVLPPQTDALWDRRFCVSSSFPAPLTIRALGRNGLEMLKKNALTSYKRFEKPVAVALPSFWHLEELVAVPHMAYLNHAYATAKCSAWFIPAKPLAGPAFFSMNT